MLRTLDHKRSYHTITQKVEATKRIAQPKNKKRLTVIFGMVNYHGDLWMRRLDALSPLSDLTRKTAKCIWTEKHNKAFESVKRVLSSEVQLWYPDFTKLFEIHTDTSEYQLGAVIAQENKPVAFFSRKLNKSQQNYTVAELELLAIVETLKEFCSVLLDQEITVCTDHET